MQTRVMLVTAWVVAQLPVMACRSAAMKPEQATAARETIVAWLECDECTSGELDGVVKLGTVAIPTLTSTLRQGPSEAKREQLRRHLSSTYQDVKQYAARHPTAKVVGSEAEYAQPYMDNLVALYQIRSATALGAIGGADARAALEEAARAALRDDVRAAVVAAL